MSAGNLRVVFFTTILTDYRVKFHSLVRQNLQKEGVAYELVYGQPTQSEAEKGDAVDIPWATRISNRYFTVGGTTLVWQPLLSHALGADMVILQQENRLLANYLLQILPGNWRPKIGFWGHGRNHQARRPSGIREIWKRAWLNRCDWWFTYTENTKKYISESGYPANRITVFNNSIDTSEIEEELGKITDDRKRHVKSALSINSENIAIYVGGLYAEKRIDFLVAAAVQVQKLLPDFVLLVLGGGVDAAKIQDAASRYDWIRYVGPRFGTEKTELVSLGKILLMPGLVGLAILDSFAYGIPMITTNIGAHSPEISYLENGVNGVMIESPDDVDSYVNEVVKMLTDDEHRRTLIEGARAALSIYTVENMADRFSMGVMRAISAR